MNEILISLLTFPTAIFGLLAFALAVGNIASSNNNKKEAIIVYTLFTLFLIFAILTLIFTCISE